MRPLHTAPDQNSNSQQELRVAILAWISIGLAILCAVWIAVDEMRYPQSMAIMNVVWPVTALYLSVFAVWAYLVIGRRHTREAMQHSGPHRATQRQGPTAAQI